MAEGFDCGAENSGLFVRRKALERRHIFGE